MSALEHVSHRKFDARQMHWYHPITPQTRRPRRCRYGSSVINNVWNAWSNWTNANERNSAGILQTMKVQINNLAQVIAASVLFGEERTVVLGLVAEVQQALNGLNPAVLNQQAQHASTRMTITRQANDRSQISSNAKAALGVLQYLGDGDLFPGCAALFSYVQERMQQVFGIMDGDMSAQDVVAVRLRQSQGTQQDTAPDGSVTPYSLPASASVFSYTPQNPNAPRSQGYTTTPPTSTSVSGLGPTAVPSPVAGLQPKYAPWSGTPNTTADGEETVGRCQDWFSTHGTTLDQFAARCSRWSQVTGGGQPALVAHLRAAGVPENIIGQTIPSVFPAGPG